jgi:hypothetical protein
MAQSIADVDITYSSECERKDWRHRMGLRQAAVVVQADAELHAHVRALALDSVAMYHIGVWRRGFRRCWVRAGGNCSVSWRWHR